ncbi:Protein Mrp homolog [Candidatus Glomeribacter gigasporarum BEG34]|uniref:Iron-sulfur cluster carrier protein n=2 Tax=cellular organisms TaxID=131567 RepID=G2JBQ6_9BURK|nr:iron-sulfur cluster carrier protein ApbC [Candidatus Glomeribacter gigasporarum]CCD30211.1 Protein Mrp homolog [Candidatus Glomeribacter gigasporarum BEG34]
MNIDRVQLDTTLAKIVDPHTGQNVLSAKNIRHLQVDGGRVLIDFTLPYPAQSEFDAWRARIIEAFAALPGVDAVQVNIRHEIIAHAAQNGMKLLPNIKNMIAVASGKGGVGKSTVAANLALALSEEGARTGLLDADIYGPSQPAMLGVAGPPESKDGKTMEPLHAYGLQINSIGFLIDADQPAVWRGPMATSAFSQLLHQTKWDALDYLIIDMPPGTGDIQLTLAQRVPVTGAVIVTTPQEIALRDAKKGLRMFEKAGIPILGVIENMGAYLCRHCGHVAPIFGAGGGTQMCTQYGVPLLGSLPLDIQMREQMDAGAPPVIAQPEGQSARLYRDIARKIAVRIARQARDMRSKFPDIVIERS